MEGKKPNNHPLLSSRWIWKQEKGRLLSSVDEFDTKGASVEDFNIGEYLKSIVGEDNYKLDQAKLRFDFAKNKENDQVTAVWAMVLAVLYLEQGQVSLANGYLDEGACAVRTLNDPGLSSLFNYLQEKTIELSPVRD